MRWCRHHIEQKETIITLLCAKAYVPAAGHALRALRTRLEDLIRADEAFETSHQPLSRSLPTPLNLMVSSAARMNVGPMACVAGLFAECALNSVLNAGAKEAVADNGGDIALHVRAPVTVGIYTGPSALNNLAFRILPTRKPLGICTSSGTVGHSFSYGRADAAVVISENITLADAAATALCNRIRDENDLEVCFGCLKPHREIQGALVVYRNRIALWGELPELVEMTVNPDLITREADPATAGSRIRPDGRDIKDAYTVKPGAGVTIESELTDAENL
jgi:ApbE superfamily uncharacterized protein (UPF0280 family)